MEVARKFHGYPAPGLIIGAYMVELAKSHMPGGVLYDAVSETSYCLPDAIQLAYALHHRQRLDENSQFRPVRHEPV